MILTYISSDLDIKEKQVKNTIELLDAGNTIPFIARYRKEHTGALDELEIQAVAERYKYYSELFDRKETVLKSIEEQGKLTPELKSLIEKCLDKQKLEDLYLPYKKRKKTRADVAIEKGLAPLAEIIRKQDRSIQDLEIVAKSFINPELEVNTVAEALAGARDIIAQQIADDSDFRGWLRKYMYTKGTLHSSPKKEWKDKKSKFEGYYNFSEPLANMPAHRVLAIRRGESEKVLSWKIVVNTDDVLVYLSKQLIKSSDSVFKPNLLLAIEDAYKRLLYPSLETECFKDKCLEAENESIKVFSSNLKNLLLAAPAGEKVIMGVDPGFRTGCKVVVIDQTGKFCENTTIYPHEPQKQLTQSEEKLNSLVSKYPVKLIAIGNGTASRETMSFVSSIIKKSKWDIIPVMVNESGASVYSASEIARSEFPDLDLTVRGAISIGRRLQDPLSELVKIDPKSIGVGQYQHDVNQQELKAALSFTTEYCVNHVGVDLNTASAALLTYIAGIGPAIAKNIVDYREKNGSFTDRKQLLKVNKLGAKAFEQCAGFLRIRNGNNPLDNSAIHPEAYEVVYKMAEDFECDISEMIGNTRLVLGIQEVKYISEKFGLPTIQDILKELLKPGLDPREEFTYARFDDEINDMSDLEIGMILEGVVTNVTNFGAFVDIGVHQDGLVHISKLAKQYVKNPADIVAVGQQIKVQVIGIDADLKRIQLMRLEPKQVLK